jgi:hypothetical protein
MPSTQGSSLIMVERLYAEAACLDSSTLLFGSSCAIVTSKVLFGRAVILYHSPYGEGIVRLSIRSSK